MLLGRKKKERKEGEKRGEDIYSPPHTEGKDGGKEKEKKGGKGGSRLRLLYLS